MFGGLDIVLTILILIILIIFTLSITMVMVMLTAIHKVTFIHTFNVKKGHVMI